MIKEAPFTPKTGRQRIRCCEIFISDFEELVEAGKKSNGTLRRYKRTEKKVEGKRSAYQQGQSRQIILCSIDIAIYTTNSYTIFGPPKAKLIQYPDWCQTDWDIWERLADVKQKYL